jgi:hypothetical protein
MYPVQKGWSKEDVCTDIMQTVKNWVSYSNGAVFAYDMSEYEIPLFYYLMQEVPLSKFPFFTTRDLCDGLEQFLVSHDNCIFASDLQLLPIPTLREEMLQINGRD